MIHHTLILSLILSLSAACARAGVVDDRDTILTGPEALRIFDQLSRPTPNPKEGQWTPTSEEVTAFREGLAKYIHDHPKLLDKSFDLYTCQFAGFIRDGRRFIYVNAVTSDKMRIIGHWQDHAVNFADGSTTSFGAEYDVDSKEIFNFEVNPFA